MPDLIKMPKLGFDMAEGTLVRWLRAEGEEVKKGDVLAEIETDKATVEVESTYSGVVNRHLVDQGAIVPVGEPIAVIAAPGEEVKDIPGLQEASQPKKAEKIEKAGSEPVESGQSQVKEKAGEGERIKASPLAKRIAKEHGIDLAELTGSGSSGRIVRKDVEEALEEAEVVSAPAASVEQDVRQEGEKLSVPAKAVEIAPPMPVFAVGEIPEDEEIPLNKLRQAIGRRMVESKQQVPHFYITHDYDFEPVMQLRKEVNRLLPQEQKTSVNDYIVKAVALALRQFPNVNASIEGDKIIRHGHVNVGVAVAVEGGLLTIVSQDTDQKPLRLLSAEIKATAQRARSGKVRPDDIEGSTFSISNLGMFDVENFAAIINPPEAAILAVSSVRQVPVVQDGEIRIGTRMKATLSADHRVTDGAEAAQFLQVLAAYFNDPLKLLI